MFFVKIYRFFNKHKLLMYSILLLSSIVFVYFGLKLQYEEDLSNLLPSSKSKESGLVFGNLKVKDKIFIQMQGESPQTMIQYIDELMDSILVYDEYIANTFYKVDADLGLSAIDYILGHIPIFVDTSLYHQFDSAIAQATTTMAENYELIMNDESGTITQMVSTDPLNLRQFILPQKSTNLGYTFIDGHIFSKDSSVILAFISPNFQSFDSKSGSNFIHDISTAIDKFSESHSDVEILLHGAPVRSAGNSDVMKHDIFFTVGIALLIILFVLCISFRSVSIISQQIFPVVYGTFFSLACMYWIKGCMSLMSLGIGSVVLGVAISYSLHVIIHQKFTGDIVQMLLDEAKPVCLGCITTIGAFLGLMFTQSELLRDFGLFATFVLIGNTLYALIFLPHFLKNKEKQSNNKILTFVDKINQYPYDRKPLIVVLVIMIIIVGIIFTPKVKFDNNLKHIGYESEKLLKSEALYAEKNNNGGIQRYYAAISPTLDEALNVNQKLSHCLDSLKNKGILTSYTPIVSQLFQSQETQKQRINAWKAYWTKEKINQANTAIHLAAQKYNLDANIFMPFQAMVEMDYETGNLYQEGIIPDGLICNFIENSNNKYLIFNAVQMKDESKVIVDEIIEQLPHTVVVDPFYYTGNMITLIHKDFNTTLLISSIFVFIVLFLSFKNIVIALIAFMPMFFSWYVVQGFMALLGLEFNLINIIISTFIFGIGVDYSIFVVQGLLSGARGENLQMLDYHKTAIFFSAFVLIVVVLIMLVATHPAIKSIGISTLIGMGATILITYSLQPLLFRWISKNVFFNKFLKK